MGRLCAWCGTVLREVGISSRQPLSHALCSGCLEDLRAALSSTGMHLRDTPLQRGVR
jgi:hypothetical protein